MDAIMILVPCPTLQRKENYSSLPRNEAFIKYKNEQFSDELIDRVRRAVLHRVEVLPGLSSLHDSILHEVIETPVDYADLYNVGAGTPFGLSHGLLQLSIFRPPSILKQMTTMGMKTMLQELEYYKLRHKLDQKHQLWQEGSHPQAIKTEAMMLQKIEYIHNNPVRRGYVDDPTHWRYSSARCYAGRTGLIDTVVDWR